MAYKRRLRKAAEDLARAAGGDLDSRELDETREHLADVLVLLEYRLRPKPSRLRLLFFAAGVTGAVGAGVVLWRSRRRLRRQLEELGASGTAGGRALVTGREAVGRAIPLEPRAFPGRLRAVRGHPSPDAEESAGRD